MKPWKTATLAAAALASASALAQANLPITPQQRSTAEQVARTGVPLSELAPDAPDSHTVKPGDTLWDISGIFLRSPWRWPELWGMNIQEVRNPHLIYPGQLLVLDKRDGRATLRVARGAGEDGAPTETVRVSPRVRISAQVGQPLPTLRPNLIEPFLSEPLIVEAGVLERAPHIVPTGTERVLLSRGDRIYARSSDGTLLAEPATGPMPRFRVFRNATPLRHPISKAVLGYEAQYLGQATLVRGEATQTVEVAGAQPQVTPVAASFDVTVARHEMRAGDRLLPEPPRQLVNYVPRAPERDVEALIVSMYGEAVRVAGPNQVVVIDKGTADGLESGHVLALERTGARVLDRGQPGARPEMVKLPDERNGLLMVFRPFERLSYALVLSTSEGVQVGDKARNPR